MTKFEMHMDREWFYFYSDSEDVEGLLLSLSFSGTPWLRVGKAGLTEFIPFAKVDRIRIAGQDPTA